MCYPQTVQRLESRIVCNIHHFLKNHGNTVDCAVPRQKCVCVCLTDCRQGSFQRFVASSSQKAQNHHKATVKSQNELLGGRPSTTSSHSPLTWSHVKRAKSGRPAPASSSLESYSHKSSPQTANVHLWRHERQPPTRILTKPAPLDTLSSM